MLKLLPYQEEGVRFLLKRPTELAGKPHRLLADEQGLGKTIQAIEAVRRLGAKTLLVICPAQVKYNWYRNLIEWGFPAESIQIVSGRNTRIEARDIIIINYDLIVGGEIHTQLMARKFQAGIVDEAHRLKTMTAARSKLVLGRKGVLNNVFYKILLTGTPVPNRPIEFYIILATLAPELIRPYDRYDLFGKRYCNGFQQDGVWNFKGASNIKELRERIKPFMLRREIKDVYTQLPPVSTEIVYMDIDTSDHPDCAGLENPSDPEAELPMATYRRVVAECKAPDAAEYVYDLLQRVPKVTVFAYHRKVIEYLRDSLQEFNPVTVYGGFNAEAKQRSVDRFIADPKSRVYLGQIISSGEGVDGLQKVCNHIVFVEMDWSAGGMGQVLSRLHRIGQTQTVFAYYLIANVSIELAMSAVLKRKRDVISQLIQSNEEVNNTMTLEQSLERIATALETLVGNMGAVSSVSQETVAEKQAAKAAKPAGKTGGKAKEAKPSLSFEDIKAAAAEFINGNPHIADAKEQARAIIKKHGAAKLDELEAAPEKWEDILADFAAGPVDNDDDMGI